ncbi:E3 ubiquitin-protein ligase rififylin [Anolis sagrei]|uniref:E3 ubiquitin-protein ligase rififylin n=1 Tax=Anolis sagrei TaxID=38937 RepID=UPI003522A5BC
MWAACCNWFCLNGQPEDMAHRPPSGSRAYANAGYSAFPSPSSPDPPTCKACGGPFGIPPIKNVCLDCKKSFCAACSHCLDGGLCRCLLCERFRATAFRREDLIKMKVKDLRDYLELRDISTTTCREKDELVGLILSQREPNPGQQEPPPAETPSRVPDECLQVAMDPQVQVEQPAQANGQALPSQDMADVEEAADRRNEEETQSINSEDNLVPGRRASLSDLTSLGDIGGLSVRQLKEILARNFVNYKGCCEKWELMERVTRLYKEKDLQQLGSDTNDPTVPPPSATSQPPSLEENLCKICMDSAIDCVLLECGHMVTCTKCGKRMNECPICRQYVIRAVHVFRT